MTSELRSDYCKVSTSWRDTRRMPVLGLYEGQAYFTHWYVLATFIEHFGKIITEATCGCVPVIPILGRLTQEEHMPRPG